MAVNCKGEKHLGAIECLVSVLGAYALLGLLFGVAFVTKFVNRIDPACEGALSMARLSISTGRRRVPAAVLFLHRNELPIRV